MSDSGANTESMLTRRGFISIPCVLFTAQLAGSQMAWGALEKSIRFGIVTDCHFADCNTAGARFYRDSLAKFQECVKFMNEQKVGFMIENGDFKDQDTPPDERRTISYLRQIEAEFKKFSGPRYRVLGNHDMDSISKVQFRAVVENTNVARDRSFYSFENQGMKFIVLDATYRSDGTDYDCGNFDWKDSNIPVNQIAWLGKELASASGAVIVFVHQRLDGQGDMFIKNAADVRAVLEKSGKVVAVFQGHDHPGGYNKIGEIHYYTLRALVEGPGLENNAYAVVEIDRAGVLTVNGRGKAASKGFSIPAVT